MFVELNRSAREVLGLAFDRTSERDPAGPHGSARDGGILLLHGFAGTPRMLRPIGRFLRRELDRPAFGLSLGLGFGDIRDLADDVYRSLDTHRISQCDVVAYSMGGLVASYLVKCLDHGRRIRRVITLGTPHRGVPLISEWRRLGTWWCRSMGQMCAGSSFLEQLRTLPLPDGVEVLSIAGGSDALVPVTAARVRGERVHNRVVPGVDHFRLLTSRRVFRCVANGLVPDAAEGLRRAS